MDLNLKLKFKIIEKFGTQYKFAKAVSRDETYISKIIRGARSLSEDEALEWAKVLGCNIKDVL